MTPEEAEGFYEDDEDPAKIFAAYDAGPKGITAPPAPELVAARTDPTPASQVKYCRDYIMRVYGRRE